MTFAEVVQTLTQLIYTTSDKGAYFLHSRYNNSGYENRVLAEYIYLKAYLACALCVNVADSNNSQEAQELISATLDNLRYTFSKMPESLNYGCNAQTLESRVNYYFAFAGSRERFNIRTAAINYQLFIQDYKNTYSTVKELADVFYETYADIAGSMTKRQQTHRSGCGCTSAIATLAAAISVLLAI